MPSKGGLTWWFNIPSHLLIVRSLP